MQTAFREHTGALVPVDVYLRLFSLNRSVGRSRSSTCDHDREWYGPCPFCGCGRDRFWLWVDAQQRVRYWCRVCHASGWGDELLRQTGHQDVLRQYGADEPPARLAALPPKTPEPPRFPEPPSWESLVQQPPVPMEIAEKYHSIGAKQMRMHLETYNLNGEALVKRFKLGYAPSFDAGECGLPAGYTFPNIATGPGGKQILRAISVRRDDAVCKAQLEARGPQWIEEAKRRLFDQWWAEFEAHPERRPFETLHEPTIEDLVEAEPGWAKYKAIAGSSKGIWNDALVTLPDNSREGPRLPYCFVVEGARDAMCFLQLGYPAVAFDKRNDWLFWLPRVFKNVADILIVGDRDERWNNAGRGEAMAREIAASLERGRKKFHYTYRIVLPPEGRDDPCTIARLDGLDGLRDWIDSLGIRHLKPFLNPIEE